MNCLITEKECATCGEVKGQDSYSGNQWTHASGKGRCMGCLPTKQTGAPIHEKECMQCGERKGKPYFSKNQFLKASGKGTCLGCQGKPPSVLTKSCEKCGETKEANKFSTLPWYAETGSCTDCSKGDNKQGRTAADNVAAAKKVASSLNKVRKAEVTNDPSALKKARAELAQAQLQTQFGNKKVRQKARRENSNRIRDAEMKKVAAADLELVAAKKTGDQSAIESAKAQFDAATESYNAAYSNTHAGDAKARREIYVRIRDAEKEKVAAAKLALVAAKKTKDQSAIESATAQFDAATESYDAAYSKTEAGKSKARRDLLVFGDGFSIKKSELFDTNHRETQTLYNPSKHSKGDNVRHIGNILSNHKNLTKEELVMQINALKLES